MTMGVMASMESPDIRRISSMCHWASRMPLKLRDSRTTSESNPWMRFCISEVNPSITLLTTIIVATPKVTLTMDTSAMYRVHKYRQQISSLYMEVRGQDTGFRAWEFYH